MKNGVKIWPVIYGVTAFVFHPIWLLLVSLVVLQSSMPYLFEGRPKDRELLVLLVFIYAVFFPLLGILLLRLLGFIKSFAMRDRTERIIPFIISAVFLLWLNINLHKQGMSHPFYSAFVLSVLISLFVFFFINLWYKISLHAGAMGMWLAFLLLWRFHLVDANIPLIFQLQESMSLHTLILISFVLAGWVCSSRIADKSHTPAEVYWGFILGIILCGVIVLLRA